MVFNMVEFSFFSFYQIGVGQIRGHPLKLSGVRSVELQKYQIGNQSVALLFENYARES